MSTYEFSKDSLVSVSVASKPVLGMSHKPTFSAAPKGGTISATESDGRFVANVTFSVEGDSLDPGKEHSRFDREKMRANLGGKDVLDTQHHPTIIVNCLYQGTLEIGTLQAEIHLRGVPRNVTFAVSIRQDGDRLHAEGQWEGTLTDLGIKPFRALLGALTLKDWVRLHFCVDLAPT